MRLTIVLFVGLFCTASVSRGDEILFKNGDRMTGTIDTYDGLKLTIKTGGNKVDVDLKNVKTFSTAEPIEVVLKDGTRIKRRVVMGADGKVSLVDASAPPTTVPAAVPRSTEPIASVFPFDQIKAINPPAVKWSGSVLLGGMITTGNSQTESLNAAGHLGRRTDKDRIQFDASYLFGRQKVPGDGTHETTNNWTIQGKYDYFFTERLYGYATARVERDVIAGLNLRFTPGVGAGYQWIDTPRWKFNTEGGVSYIYRDYSNDGTSESVSLRVAYHLIGKIADKVSVFHNFEYLPGLDRIENYLITADAGLRTDITGKLFAEFKVEWRYDSKPAPGKVYNDARYIASLGWAF
jgi:putative salt-induced outer membrane protein YdiY